MLFQFPSTTTSPRGVLGGMRSLVRSTPTMRQQSESGVLLNMNSDGTTRMMTLGISNGMTTGIPRPVWNLFRINLASRGGVELSARIKDYAQELGEQTITYNKDFDWPLTCIDWAQAAWDLQMAYTPVEIGGVTFWVQM